MLALFAYSVASPANRVTGLALAYAATYMVGLALSTAVLRRRLHGIDGQRVVRTYVRLVLAAAPSALLAWFVAGAVTDQAGVTLLGSLAACVAGGVVLLGGFFGLCRVMHVAEVGVLLATVRGRAAQ